jgi:hypothetical protein
MTSMKVQINNEVKQSSEDLDKKFSNVNDKFDTDMEVLREQNGNLGIEKYQIKFEKNQCKALAID